MFKWFDRDKNSNVVDFPVPKLVPPMPVVTPPKLDNKPLYTVGNNKDGDVVLTVNGETVSITLTMNNQAVDHLINLLEAAK